MVGIAPKRFCEQYCANRNDKKGEGFVKKDTGQAYDQYLINEIRNSLFSQEL